MAFCSVSSQTTTEGLLVNYKTAQKYSIKLLELAIKPKSLRMKEIYKKMA